MPHMCIEARIFNRTGGDKMKKLLSIFVAILFAFTVSGLCFAQDAGKPASEQPKVEEKAPAKTHKVKKTTTTKKSKTKKQTEEKKEGEPAPAGK